MKHLRYIGKKANLGPRLVCVGLGVLLLAACGRAATLPSASPAAPQPRPTLAPQPTPAALSALAERVAPCDALANGAPSTVPTQSAAEPGEQSDTVDSAVVHYDDASNTIVLRKGADTSLAGVSRVLERAELLQELAPGEWLLSANLRVEPGAALRLAAPVVRWLKLRSDDQGFVWLKAQGGRLEFADTCVSSWDAARGGYDENFQNGRSFVLARKGAQMDIRASDLRYLGYNGPESYGLAWRLSGTTGQIVDSFVSHNFYGVYSFEVDDLVIRGNETHHNVMYGIDPHTRSMRLVIEDNVAHHNGKHGIILAEECSDGLVRNNVAFNNLHHGIVIYQRSNNNVVEGNTAYGNGGQGINVNDSAGTVVRGNTVYDNLEAGIGVGQSASATQLLENSVLGNRKDGIALYSDAKASLLRDNTISDNARYGIYVKSEGRAQINGNEIARNTVGIYLNTVDTKQVVLERNRVHSNREADLRPKSEQAASVAEDGSQ
jgi:parallel beta-helix repeat protein